MTLFNDAIQSLLIGGVALLLCVPTLPPMTATIVIVTIMLEAIPLILQLLAVARPIYLLLLPFAACVQKTDTPPTIRSRACARLGRYELMLTINPLLVVGGTGPPANTVAFF